MIETLCQQVLRDFPVRKTPAQKAAFRRWLTEELEGLGYIVSTEEGGRVVKSRNLVAGNPEGAAVVFTAHYDTCARLPLPNFIVPRNLLFTLLLQLPMVLFFLFPLYWIFISSITTSPQTCSTSFMACFKPDILSNIDKGAK